MTLTVLLLRCLSVGSRIRNYSSTSSTSLKFAQRRTMVGPNVKIRFAGALTPSDPQLHPVTIVGLPKNLAKVTYEDIRLKLGSRVSSEVFAAAAAAVQSSPEPCPLYLNLATLAPLPTKCSRHNAPSRAHALSKIIRSSSVGVDEYILVVCEKNDVFPSACAIARAYPLYSRKTNGSYAAADVKTTNVVEDAGSAVNDAASTVTVEFLLVGSDEKLSNDDLQCCQDAADAVRLAARIVDAPCNEMNTDAFLEEIKRVGRELNIEPMIIRGEELQTRGMGGIYGVGKAAAHPPALAVLSHLPAGALYNVAWVGKGIVYDTGGLSLKGKTAMPGMKRDCGGAAGILGAFSVAVKQGFNQNLHAVFCLAENAVGPLATRPDDIHTLYSGRTVEINNTDAEGRLVLADGVVYAKRDLKCDVILDMATLTGAQGIATGKYHAAILTNNEAWEDALVVAGKRSGDLTYPLVYCPELHFNEFASAVADMKNSVSDRNNALASCSALFVQAHLGFDYPGAWMHVDMASPVHAGERATGYGVALLNCLFGQYSGSALLKALALDVDVQKVNIEAGDEKLEGTNAKKMRLV